MAADQRLHGRAQQRVPGHQTQSSRLPFQRISDHHAVLYRRQAPLAPFLIPPKTAENLTKRHSIPDQRYYGGIRWGYGGIAAARAGLTRLVVLSPTNQAGTPAARLWTNVEMTVYARREAPARRLDYQAFYLSARNGERHNDSSPCEGA